MMWVAWAFLSAFLLGCYDVSKKMAVSRNAVIPVLFLNTMISSLLFLPFVLLSYRSDMLDGTMFYVPRVSEIGHRTDIMDGRIFLGQASSADHHWPC